MSVTFTFATFQETAEHGTILVMGADHTHRRPADCCLDADLYFGQCDHNDADREACGCEAFDVNLANANAMSVLGRLGYGVDPHGLSGEADPDDFLGRCMVGNVGQDDTGAEPTTTKFESGACMIDCGIRPGYYGDTLDRLAALATEAKARGCMIAWA